MDPRRPPFLPGNFYHIYNRGVSRMALFPEATNYIFVLRKVKKYSRDLNLTAIAYCLMPNHYHFLLRQDGEQPAGQLAQRVFNSYSKAYNKRYDHSGTLFEGPYRVKSVPKEGYLRHLCRYIHANPVKAGLVPSPADWPYSNYLEWTGQRAGTLVDHQIIADHFPKTESYPAFVKDYLLTSELPADMVHYLREWGAE